MKCYATKIIELAIEELGYIEKASNNNLESKTENTGNANWNKFANFIDENFPNFYNGKKNGYAWCDIFVDYLFLKTFGYENALRLLCQPEFSYGAGCNMSLNYYNAQGRFKKSPIKGSQIFFSYKNDSTINHTGIVIDFDENNVYTIEGNSNERVAKREYKLSDKTIVGYGIPNYDKENDNENKKTLQEIAQEVLAGKWGNGAERKQKLVEAGYSFEEIQKIVNGIIGTPDEIIPATDTFEVTVDTNKYSKIVIHLGDI